MKERDIRLLMECTRDRDTLPGMMRGVELQRTQTIKAGQLLWCRSFPIWDTAGKKAAEQKLTAIRDRKGTKQAQQALNARRAEERLVQLINLNFSPGDIFLTCTYEGGRQPEDLTRARRDMRNFVARLKRFLARKGAEEPAYVYVTEILEKKRGTEYHHHMLIKGELKRDDAERLWEQGGHGHGNTKIIKRLKEGLMGIGKYMAKQVCSAASADEFTARHRWAASKGLKRPEATEADKKISRRRVEQIAEAMQRDPVVARAHLERVYPGYEVIDMRIKTSDFVTGAYVYAILAKKEDESSAKRHDHAAAGMAGASSRQPAQGAG